MSKKVSLFAETIVNTDASDGKIIFHDTKMTHCYFIFTFSAMYGTITHGQNIQNDQKKELFFTPHSCGVSFCPGRSPGLFTFFETQKPQASEDTQGICSTFI